jgi:hypothetical protein
LPAASGQRRAQLSAIDPFVGTVTEYLPLPDGQDSLDVVDELVLDHRGFD